MRHRSSLERYFTPKASAICFPSVKGGFCSPSVLIYREVRVRTRAPVKMTANPKLAVSTIFGWAVRGSACSAGGRCGASRLARCAGKRSRVYSAPRPDGFEPMSRQQKSGRHPPVAFLFYGGPSGVQPAPQAAAAALSRLARCAGKRSRVYSAPRPDGFEPVSRQQKSDQPESIAFYSMVGRQGFEPWTLGLKVPCSAS